MTYFFAHLQNVKYLLTAASEDMFHHLMNLLKKWNRDSPDKNGDDVPIGLEGTSHKGYWPYFTHVSKQREQFKRNPKNSVPSFTEHSITKLIITASHNNKWLREPAHIGKQPMLFIIRLSNFKSIMFH